MRNRDQSPKVSEPAYLPVTYDPTLAFVHPALVKALTYWNLRRGDRAMPSRSDLTPQGMRAFLPHVALIDVLDMPGAEPDYFIRLAGTAIEQVIGPRSGKTLATDTPPGLALRWRTQYDMMLRSRKPLRSVARIGYHNKTWLEGEHLSAPLSDDGEKINAIFWVFAVTTPEQ
jgi:hypothetical protein